MRKGLLGSAAALALTLGGCGSDDTVRPCPPGQVGSPPNCTVPPPPCTQTSVLTDSGGVRSLVLVIDDFPVTESGRLDMTLDWTNASSPMGLYLVPAGTCTLDEFNRRACNFLVQSEPGGPKPRRVSAASLSAGNYRYMVANYASTDESVALQIVLSKGTCPAIANASPSASAQERGAALAVERAERR